MALIVSGFDVVVRVAGLTQGLEAFRRSVPNSTFCTDGVLARASFMANEDRAVFLLGLRGMPLESVATIDRHDLGHAADWLDAGRYAGVDAVWLRGTDADPLVVPMAWTPAPVFFGGADRFEYLRTEGAVAAYRDKQTGREVFAGRTQPVAPSLPPELAQRVETLRLQGSELVKGLMLKRRLGFFEKRRVRKGVARWSRSLQPFRQAGPQRGRSGCVFAPSKSTQERCRSFARLIPRTRSSPTSGESTPVSS